jgi:peptide/nickel transport system substrate-binding protein
MRRRDLAVLGAALALPRLSRAQVVRAQTLKMVPQANLTSLDPIWTTANITRNYAFMVYDTLYGLDAQYRPQPQMAAGHEETDDGRTVTITLREGLKWHDGAPVTAADCAASVQRWMRRSPHGQKLATVAEAVEAVDDQRLRFRLKRRYPMLLAGLASPVNPVCFIMPARVAATDAFTQVRETIGSGPFRFKRDEFNSGSLVVFERNPDYRPRSEPASLTAGGKIAGFPRVEWHIITDPSTSAAALQSGEIDWFEQVGPEHQQLFRRDRNIGVERIDPLPLSGILRFNHLHPPFNDRKLRQAVAAAVNQADYMVAVAGDDRALYATGTGVFTPGSPMASDVGLEKLRSPSIDRAKAMLREAGYTNQPMRLIGPTDILAPAAMTQVGGDMFRRLGMNLDFVLADWGTTVTRRTSKEPVERGGWSVLYTSFTSTDFLDPSAHTPLRGNGDGAWPGWPTIPRLEELRDAWFEAPTQADQQRICREIQLTALEELPFVPVGAYYGMTALRRDVVGRVPGFAIYWNMRRA